MYDKYSAPTAAAGITVIGAPAAPSDAEVQRLFLGQRLRTIFYDKEYDLIKLFKMEEYALKPKTAKEAAARLLAGQFTIKGADKDETVPYTNFQHMFSWRGPDDKADEAGFKAAMDVLEKVYTDGLDKIRIADPKDGLVILEAFKDWTFTPASPAVAA